MSHSKSEETASSSQLFPEFPPISLEEWEAQIHEDLQGKDYREHLTWKPIDTFPIYPFYRREDLESLDYLKQEPGRFPFVRGSDPTGNRWLIREAIYDRKAESANHASQHALKKGSESLSFKMKPHPSDSMLGGDLEGINVQNQHDFSTLLESINLEEISLYLDTDMATPAYLAMLSNEVSARKLDPHRVKAAFTYDPFTYAVANGRWLSKPEQISRTAAHMVHYSQATLPGARPLAVNLPPYHYSGASNVQELGIALAIGQSYMARLTDLECSPSEVEQHLHFAVPVGTSYFLEIAKLRALRLLWSRVLAAYLPEGEEPDPAVIHASTSTWSHSKYDAYNNLVRNTSQALSAVIGGCNSLQIAPHDLPFRKPGDFSQRIARNIQHIMREESHFDKVADPSGGSYYIETLTDELARHAWNFFQEIEKQGGFVKSVRNGYLQSVINRTRQKRNESIAKGETAFIGVNQYPDPDDTVPDTTVTAYTSSSLLRSDNNYNIDEHQLLESLSDAFQNGAFLGDVLNTLVKPSREFLQTLHPGRGPQPFEKLRKQTEAFSANTGTVPTVLFIPMGNPARRKQRVNFAANLLGCAGYNLVEPLGFDAFDEAKEKIREVNPEILVFCAPDDKYGEMVENLSSWLHNLESPPTLCIAGHPVDQVERFREQGVDYFIHRKTNRLELLQILHRQLGVTGENTSYKYQSNQQV